VARSDAIVAQRKLRGCDVVGDGALLVMLKVLGTKLRTANTLTLLFAAVRWSSEPTNAGVWPLG